MSDNQQPDNTGSGENPLKLAKDIRKENEPWQEAVKRASRMLKEQQSQENASGADDAQKSSDWRDAIIQTDVDTLLQYVAKHGEVAVKDAIAHTDVPEETVQVWINALVNENIIEKDYTAKGAVLRMDAENKATVEEKVDELEQEVKENVSQAEETIQSEDSFVQQVKEELQYMGEVLEKDRKRERQLQKALQDIYQQEQRLHEEEEELEERIDRVLDEMEESLQHIQAAEEWIAEFTQVKQKLQRNVRAMKTLKDVEDSESAEETLSQVTEQKAKIERITSRLKKTLWGVLHGNR